MRSCAEATHLIEICRNAIGESECNHDRVAASKYLYPSFQHALVKGPFVHTVSLSISPMSDAGTATAQAKGASANNQRRLYIEAITVK